MSQAPPPGQSLDPDDDAVRWQAAKQIRQEHPDWVVIWIARTGQFKAYPKFAAPRGTAPTAPTPEELAAQMEQIEQAARSPRGRSRQPGDRRRSSTGSRARHGCAGPWMLLSGSISARSASARTWGRSMSTWRTGSLRWL